MSRQKKDKTQEDIDKKAKKIADVIKSDDSVIDENVPSIDNSNKPIFYI